MNGEKIICQRVFDGVNLYIPRTFNLAQIADSGQCFRLTTLSDGAYVAITGDHLVKITPSHLGGYVFHCSFEEFRDVWIPYFDLTTNYAGFQEKMMSDPFLKEAIEDGGGIRILRQDLWEMVVTYIISQRNNIPKIRKAVNTLSELYGTFLGEIDGHNFYSFPTPDQLRGKDLSPVSLGYREDYVKSLSDQDDEFWDQIREQDDDTAHKMLVALHGVGEKVANCVMLFGLHRMDSYPRDVWINRMIDDVYHGEFDPSKYPGYAGYVQQLQFFHYRNMAKGEKRSGS